MSRIYGTANANAAERTYANSFSYMPDGRIEKLKLGNGLWESAKFNDRLQVTEFNLGHGAASGDVWKLGIEYGELEANGTVNTAKNTGNIARQTVSFSGLAQPFVQTYKYDSLYRLTESKETSNSQQTWKQSFGYDRFGNRVAHDKFIGATQIGMDAQTHPTIDPATNRFLANQGYLYDKNGNLTSDAENRAFTFNGDNKQTVVMNGAVKVGEYFYDGDGKRIKKKTFHENGVLKDTTVFVYDGTGKMVAEYSTQPPPKNPTTNYTMNDQLGSPRVITNALGEVVSRRDFLPFGEEITPDGNYRKTESSYNFGDDIRQKFTGYQKDEETQLDFAEARMYENRHARFTAVDPLLASGKSANPQSFNRYVYVMNNPLFYTDPTGLQSGTWIYDNRVTDENRPVYINRPLSEGERVWDRGTTYETADGDVTLDPFGPLHLGGEDAYFGYNLNGVSQGTGIYSPESRNESNSSTNSFVYASVKNINTLLGAGVSGAEHSFVFPKYTPNSVGLFSWKGNNGQVINMLERPNYYGNQHNGSRYQSFAQAETTASKNQTAFANANAKATNQFKGIKMAGKALFGASVVLGTIDGATAYQRGDSFGTKKAGVDVTMAGVGTFGGPVGGSAAVIYFGVDFIVSVPSDGNNNSRRFLTNRLGPPTRHPF